jgi:hypothetical protein
MNIRVTQNNFLISLSGAEKDLVSYSQSQSSAKQRMILVLKKRNKQHTHTKFWWRETYRETGKLQGRCNDIEELARH